MNPNAQPYAVRQCLTIKSNIMERINWRNSEDVDEGNYIVAVLRPSTGEMFTTTDYYELCSGWQHYGEGTPYKVVAYFPIREIEPYIDPIFKIGQFVVENQIVGTVTKIYDDLKLLVIGRNLRSLVFHPETTRLATKEEALEISAHYRELGYFYNIDKNEFYKY